MRIMLNLKLIKRYEYLTVLYVQACRETWQGC
jgi:hypothetical protein